MLGTFLPPSISPEVLLGRGVVPDAWDKYNLTTGYVSDIDLYKHVFTDKSEYMQTYNRIDMPEILSIGSALNNIWSTSELPIFGSDDMMVPIDSDMYHKLSRGAIQLIQEEGDMVIIPPGWWHQVYHLDNSIGIAGQYCNEEVKDGVFRHILTWCACEEKDIGNELLT